MNKYLITLLFIFGSSPALAIKVGEKLELHGFFEQGFVYTTNNPYFTDTTSGSADFREFALNASWRASDNLRFAGQVLARQAGESDTDYVNLDFLLADYQAYGDETTQFGVRGGRFKIPYGFYNSTRDSSVSHAGAFVPYSVYFDTFRSLMLSSDGINLYGAYTGDSGLFSLDLYSGSRTMNGDSFEQYLFSSNIPGEFNEVDIGGFKLTYIPDANYDLNFSLSLARPTFELANVPTLQGPALLEAFIKLSQNPNDAPEFFTDIDVDVHLYMASVQYGLEDWLFTAEYMHVESLFSDIEVLYQQQEQQQYNGQGFYIQGEWFISPTFQGFWRYEELVFDIGSHHDSHNELDTIHQRPASLRYSEAATIGMRWHFNDRLFLSTQYSINEGTAWLPAYKSRDNNNLQKHWQLFAMQITYSF